MGGRLLPTTFIFLDVEIAAGGLAEGGLFVTEVNSYYNICPLHSVSSLMMWPSVICGK